jgi:hypothetical protein
VTVRLPGGRAVEARLLRWQRRHDGGWDAHVDLAVPAASVRQLVGEKYEQVPRTPAYVVQTVPSPTGHHRPQLVLHTTDCPLIDDPDHLADRVTPVEDTHQAQFALKFPDTTPCETCTPSPGQT